MPEYKLHYFPLHVRADGIRTLLSTAGADWENNVVEFAQWGELKKTGGFPGNQVPCLELADGTKLGQSVAILRLLGHKHGYYPTDAMEAY